MLGIRKYLLIFAIASFYLLSVYCQKVQDVSIVEPEVPLYSISGKLFDYASKESLSAVTVFLRKNLDAGPVDSAVVDAAGIFNIQNLTFDITKNWWISFVKPKYYTLHEEIEFEEKGKIPDTYLHKTLQLMDIVSAGSEEPSGIVWDNRNIWTVDKASGDMIKHNAQMEIIERFPTGITRPVGLAWDQGIFYTCSYDNNGIYQIDVNSSSVDSIGIVEYMIMDPKSGESFPHPPTDITWKDNSLVCCEIIADSLSFHNFAKSEFFYFRPGAPVIDPEGITWAGNGYFLCPATGILYLDDNFNTIYHFIQNAETEGRLNIITWDGNFIWGIDKKERKILKYKM